MGIFGRKKSAVSPSTLRQMTAAPEEHEQEALARVLDWWGVVWCHVPNGGYRYAATGAKLRRQGVKRGVPDCLIFDPPPRRKNAPGVAIELKVRAARRRARPTPEQQKWLELLAARGWVAIVAYGAEDATQQLEDLGFGRRRVRV